MAAKINAISTAMKKKTTPVTTSAKDYSFLELPSELIQNVLGHLSYDEVSRCRTVCKGIEKICQQILNAGFHRVERFHSQSLSRVKAQLPRRESERRTHDLARHVDILTSIETRLSLLSMTYGKYVDNGICCFIPGKVLDEMFRVLRIVNSMPGGDSATRPHELLQELRDISSMAMEHFEEHILPSLRDRTSLSQVVSNNQGASSLSTSALVLCAAAFGNPPLLSVAGLSTVPKAGPRRSQRIHDNAACSGQQHYQYESLRKQYQAQRSDLAIYKRELAQLRATQRRQKDKMSEMERRLNEHEQRFTDILAQLRNSGVVIGRQKSDTAIEMNASSSTTAAGPSRKRVAQREEGALTAGTSTTRISRAIRALKRRKTNDNNTEDGGHV